MRPLPFADVRRWSIAAVSRHEFAPDCPSLAVRQK
jgi:hypothetical protein